MRYQIYDLYIGMIEDTLGYGEYRLDVEADSLEGLIDNAWVTRIGNDGSEVDCGRLGDMPKEIDKAGIYAIVEEYYKQKETSSENRKGN